MMDLHYFVCDFVIFNPIDDYDGVFWWFWRRDEDELSWSLARVLAIMHGMSWIIVGIKHVIGIYTDLKW